MAAPIKSFNQSLDVWNGYIDRQIGFEKESSNRLSQEKWLSLIARVAIAAVIILSIAGLTVLAASPLAPLGLTLTALYSAFALGYLYNTFKKEIAFWREHTENQAQCQTTIEDLQALQKRLHNEPQYLEEMNGRFDLAELPTASEFFEA